MSNFDFIDLFAGIGGLRIAFEKAGGRCVFSSEYDRFAQKTYEAYFGERPIFSDIAGDIDPPGDITKLAPHLIPDHDILVGGFPCQPFSLAGVSKKNSLGRPHGFDDPTQGTLFFNIKEIIREKEPKAFLLENVKNLKNHDKKNTYRVIREALDDLGYEVFDRVINAKGWVPQNRERIYIIGFKKPQKKDDWEVAEFNELYNLKPPSKSRQVKLSDILEKNVPAKYTLTPKTWATLIRHKEHHSSRGNGFGYGLIEAPFEEKTTRTISARYHKDGAEILIAQKGSRPRRLTPLEASRLMGFPKKFQKFYMRDNNVEQPVSDTQAYRQFGNSVAVPLVRKIARLMVKKLIAVKAFNDES
jgi:DNA (cytosine-5)-methyltransferase 1